MKIRTFAVASCLLMLLWFLTGCGSGTAPQQATSQPGSEAPSAGAPAPAPDAAAVANGQAPKGTVPRENVPKSAAAAISGEIKVRTTSALSTKTNQTGESFEASLASPILSGGAEILPKGTPVVGKVAEADPGGRVKGRATISIELTGIRVGNRVIPISTNTFEQEAPATKKKDAAKIGIGAGIGAAIGAVAGGAKGAAIGAGAGGGAGTAAVLATRGDPAEIPSETVLTFKLAKPVSIPSR